MSGYIGNIPVPQATQTRQSFTATASQTTFNTAGYSVGYVDVFLNGVKLAPADYTATNGSDVILAVGAASGDILETVAYEIFQVLDQDFTGDFTVDGTTFVVDSTNNRVGVGTASPARKFEVHGTSSESNRLISVEHTGADYAFITFSDQNTTDDGSVRVGGLGNDLIAFAGNSERMRIDSSGNVLIGQTDSNARLASTSTTNKQLSLRYTGVASYYTSVDSSGNYIIDKDGAERMRITSSGNVGIGATSPSSTFRTSIYGDGSSIIGGVEFRNAAAGGSTFTIGHASATSASATLNVTDAANLVFKTNDTERMRITSTGDVLVGTSSDYAENVQAAFYGASNGGIALASGTSGLSRLMFADGVAGTAGAYVGSIIYSHADDSMRFNVNGGTERMRISSTGKVGINNSSPVEDLHIKGTNPRINVEGDASSYYPSIRVTGNFGGISLGTYYGGNIHGENGIAFFTGSSATDSGTRRMTLSSGGGFSVGTTGLPTSGSAGVSLQPAGNVHCGVATVASTDVMRFDNPNGRVGSISVTGTSTSYNTSSDYRLKENVTDVTDGITRVKQLAPKRFNFIADPDTTVDGFIAHEVQDVIPEAISGAKDAMRDEEYEVTPAVEATFDEEGNVLTAAVDAVMGTRSVPDYQGIDQSKLVPLLTAALQEAIAKIETLETEMTSVKARLDALEAN